MIRIHFSDRAAKRRAIAFLLGRFSFKSFKSGVMLVPEPALSCLARENISFVVEGSANYADFVPTIRDSAAAAI